MDGRCLLLFAFLLGSCLCPLSSLAVQRSGSEGLQTVDLDGRALWQSSIGKRLLRQVRELQVVKLEAEKEKVVKKTGHKEDTTVPRSETGASLDAESSAGPDNDNTTKLETKPGGEETHSATTTSIPPPPPSVEREDKTLTPENKTDGTKSLPKAEEPDGHSNNNGTNSDTGHRKTGSSCGGSHCEDPKKKLISACLRIPGDGPHQLSLLITNEGDESVMVKVTAPEFLIADPVEVLVSKEKSETIHFLMDSNHKETLLKPDAMQNKTIAVSSVFGVCEVAVPTEYLRNSIEEREPHFLSSLPSMDPRVIAYLLAFAFFASCIGAWLCYKCRGKKRAGDVKYQQLEMNGLGQSSPKERGERPGTDSWDEVWDDDWEDTEAAKSSSSRLSQSLSSRGLAARRGTKDGWDD